MDMNKLCRYICKNDAIRFPVFKELREEGKEVSYS